MKKTKEKESGHYNIPVFFPFITERENEQLDNDLICNFQKGEGDFVLNFSNFNFTVKGGFWGMYYHKGNNIIWINSLGEFGGITEDTANAILNNEIENPNKPNSDMFNEDGTWKNDEKPIVTNYKDAGTILTQLERPERYASREVNGMDVIDLCKHWNLNFNEGNILKYLLRDKGEDISDMKKIIDYAQRELKYLENETSNKED